MTDIQEKAVITVNDLVQRMGSKEVLKKVSFVLHQGECLGIFGWRGSGKTTLLHSLAGINRISAGKVDILGYDVNKPSRYQRALGLVTQQPSLFKELNVLENLDFISTLKGARKEDIAPLVERMDLQTYLHQAVSHLDLGIYQRLSLAVALLNNPQILIIDEIIKDIDPYSRRLILNEIKSFLAAGGSCLWGFSNIEDAVQMDRVVWLEEGSVNMFQPQEAVQKWEQMRSEQ